MSCVPTEKSDAFFQSSSQREKRAEALQRKPIESLRLAAAALQQSFAKHEPKGREEGRDREESRARKRGRFDTFEEGKKRLCLRNIDSTKPSFQVPSDEKISTVTQMIAQQIGTPIEKLLCFRDSPVPNTFERLDSWSNMSFSDLDLSAGSDIFYEEEKQFFLIYVKTHTGGKENLYVSSDTSIGEVKRQIEKKRGGRCVLMFGGKLLELDKTLAHYNIQEKSTLNLNQCFQIFVKGLRGESETYVVCSDSTIEEFAKQIEKRSGVPHDQQRLIHAGKQLEHDKTLYDLNITKECTVHLVLRFRGS